MVEIELYNISGTRTELRKRIHDIFSDEEPGTGTGQMASRYRYYVEVMANGGRIFLKRPTWLNKGVDFMVCAEGVSFRDGRYSDMARFADIMKDLRTKQSENPTEYLRARELVECVYQCHVLNDEQCRTLNFTRGHSIELILKLLKWLFIEQDVTYWNYSGRAKLYGGLEEAGLV